MRIAPAPFKLHCLTAPADVGWRGSRCRPVAQGARPRPHSEESAYVDRLFLSLHENVVQSSHESLLRGSAHFLAGLETAQQHGIHRSTTARLGRLGLGVSG